METDAIYRRAGGRRKYNKQRQAAMYTRHWNLRNALWALPRSLPADESLVAMMDELAEYLGVSRATVYRDLAAIGHRGDLARRRGRDERRGRVCFPPPPAHEWIDFVPEVLLAILADEAAEVEVPGPNLATLDQLAALAERENL